jgi:hypothetical protein
MKFLNFFQLLWVIFALLDSDPYSGSGFRTRIRIHWPDWIRIEYGSGSETLVDRVIEVRTLLRTWLAELGKVIIVAGVCGEGGIPGPPPPLAVRLTAPFRHPVKRRCLYGSSGAVLRIRIRDPVPFWPLDPGYGMGRKSASGSGIRDEQTRSYFLELRNHFFGLKYLNSLMRIGDPAWRQFGSGIRDGKKSDPG